VSPESTVRISRRRRQMPLVAALTLILVAVWITAPAAMAAAATVGPALASDTPTPAPLPTDTPTPAPLPTDTPTPEPLPTDTPTPAPLPTDTPTPIPTPTPTPVPTFSFPTPPVPTPSPLPTFSFPTPPPPTPTPLPTLSIPTPAPTPFTFPTQAPSGAPIPKTVTHTQPPAAAQIGTLVSLQIPTGSVVGRDVIVVAVLRDANGGLLAGQHLTFYLDGTAFRSDKTDANGRVSFTILGKVLAQARVYQVGVLFAGSHGYSGSSLADKLTILNAAIQVVTVPPLPGIRFTLGSAAALTGPDGVAAMPVPSAGTYQLTADLNAPQTDPSIRATFVRWLDEVFTSTRTVVVTGPATYTIGLRVAYRATIKYVDLNNQPVDASLVDQAQFSTGTGSDDVVINRVTGAQDVWWASATTIRAAGQLVATPITYRALSVQIHGAQVVNRGQQSWTPTENGVWTIQVLLYGMTVQTRDALFGTPVAGKLQLTYPDGFVTTQALGSNGSTTFVNLPRGQYQLKLASSSLTPPTPVALSKPQAASLRVITMADITVAVGLLLALIAILALIGRWSLLKNRARGRTGRRAASAAGPAA
jgi:hypothetical protein